MFFFFKTTSNQGREVIFMVLFKNSSPIKENQITTIVQKHDSLSLIFTLGRWIGNPLGNKLCKAQAHNSLSHRTRLPQRPSPYTWEDSTHTPHRQHLRWPSILLPSLVVPSTPRRKRPAQSGDRPGLWNCLLPFDGKENHGLAWLVTPRLPGRREFVVVSRATIIPVYFPRNLEGSAKPLWPFPHPKLVVGYTLSISFYYRFARVRWCCDGNLAVADFLQLVWQIPSLIPLFVVECAVRRVPWRGCCRSPSPREGSRDLADCRAQLL